MKFDQDKCFFKHFLSSRFVYFPILAKPPFGCLTWRRYEKFKEYTYQDSNLMANFSYSLVFSILHPLAFIEDERSEANRR